MSTEPPSGTLTTPIGTVHFTMTQADHVYLHTESRSDEAITIRGIRYHVGFHCHLVCGVWTVKDSHEPYLSRKDNCIKDASPAARATARGILSTAWTDYLAGHLDLIRKAALARATYDVEKLVDELAELEQKTAAKRAELKAARKALAAI
jgi:hypothetical protein